MFYCLHQNDLTLSLRETHEREITMNNAKNNATKNNEIKTQFTEAEIKKIQEEFISKFHNQTKNLSKEEFKTIVEKHLGRDFWNN